MVDFLRKRFNVFLNESISLEEEKRARERLKEREGELIEVEDGALGIFRGKLIKVGDNGYYVREDEAVQLYYTDLKRLTFERQVGLVL